jgi:hypothetical protein
MLDHGEPERIGSFTSLLIKWLACPCVWIILTIFLLSSCSWGFNDRSLMITYSVFSAIDAAQTSQIPKAGLRELNPLYAKENGEPDMRKVIIAKVVGTALIYALLDKNEENRPQILAIANGIQGGVVVWNDYWLSNSLPPYEGDLWAFGVTANPCKSISDMFLITICMAQTTMLE